VPVQWEAGSGCKGKAYEKSQLSVLFLPVPHGNARPVPVGTRGAAVTSLNAGRDSVSALQGCSGMGYGKP